MLGRHACTIFVAKVVDCEKWVESMRRNSEKNVEFFFLINDVSQISISQRIGPLMKTMTKRKQILCTVPLWIGSKFSRSDARFFQWNKHRTAKKKRMQFSFMGIKLINFIANYFIIFRRTSRSVSLSLRRPRRWWLGNISISSNVIQTFFFALWTGRKRRAAPMVYIFRSFSRISLTKRYINLNNNRKFTNHDWLTITFWLIIQSLAAACRTSSCRRNHVQKLIVAHKNVISLLQQANKISQ